MQAKTGDEVASKPKTKLKKNVYFHNDSVANSEHKERESVVERSENEELTSMGERDHDENQAIEVDIQNHDDGGMYIPSASESDDEGEF